MRHLSRHCAKGLLAAALTVGSALAWAEAIPFEGDYDRENHVGSLAVPGPDRKPVVIRRRKGLQVVDTFDLERQGRQAVLVLWGTYPNPRWTYPELWVKVADDRTRRIWPSNPDLEWQDAWVRTVTRKGSTDLVVQRRLSPATHDEAPVRTRERLRLGRGGLVLAAKKVSSWRTAAQLRTVLADQLATGRQADVAETLARFEAESGALEGDDLQAVEALLTDYLARVGAEGYEGARAPSDLWRQRPARRDGEGR